jgi:hypothetical protein
MPAITPEMLDKLKQKFGPKIDLDAQNDVLKDLLAEILDQDNDLAVASYDRTYNRGYERQGYDRTYQQYDRTN